MTASKSDKAQTDTNFQKWIEESIPDGIEVNDDSWDVPEVDIEGDTAE